MVNIFLLGKKGLESISGINPTLLESVNQLIIGKDAGVVNDFSTDIEAFAKENAIAYSFRTDADSQKLSKASLNIAIGWRWIIPLDLPLVVFHDSILPKYRGFNPLVSALINGDSEIGVTALFGTDEFDKGDIIGQRIIPIQYPIKIETAIEELSKEYAILLGQILAGFAVGSLEGKPQQESEASFSLWRDDEDYRIDWHDDSNAIKRMIDAVSFPYKGANTMMDGTSVRVFDAEVFPDVCIVNRSAGKVLFKHDNGLVIVCGKGLLKIRDFYNDNNELLAISKFRIRFK